MIDRERFSKIIDAYKADPDSVYHTWFARSEERLKAFRSIRRGVEQVARDIKDGSFGNDFRGSSLEFVLNSITEQKQVFTGAAHAFYWKPKLRIPDIYENEPNKIAFGQFLEECLRATSEEQILRAILSLDARSIKGLGPAVANILYFLHPTLMPPSNTPMLKGFNLLFGEDKKLGSWHSYLEMRNTLIALNSEFRALLSKDLGAIAGLLFEVGSGKLVLAENSGLVLENERQRFREIQNRRHLEVELELREDDAHVRMQMVLAKMGNALGYAVSVASNDRNRSCAGEALSCYCLDALPELGMNSEVAGTAGLIDVIWLEKAANRVVCAFEVEKTTSIYSGILRLADLALALPDHAAKLFLVAPDAREREVLAQLKRPSVLASAGDRFSYLLFSDLDKHWESVCHLGTDHRILDRLAKKPSDWR